MAVAAAVPDLRCAPAARLGSGSKFLLVLLVCLQAVFCWSARTRSLRADVDLRAFYAAGVALRTGHAHTLYNAAQEQQIQQALFSPEGRTLPFLYPPFAALPFVPLSLLPYRSAFLAFLLINVALLSVCAVLVLRELRHLWLTPGWLLAMFLAFFPTAIALMQGQISCVLLLLFTSSWLLLRHNRPLAAGLCLSLGLVKFQLVLPIVLLYLLWKNYAVLKGFLLGAACLLPLSIAITGLAGLRAYLERLHGVGSSTLLDPTRARQLYGMQTSGEPNLHGLLTTLFSTHPGAATGTLILSVIILLACSRAPASLTIALPAAMLVSYHMQPYDLILLLLPLTVLSLQATPPRMLLTASILILIVPLAPILLIHQQTCFYVLAIVTTLCAAARSRAGKEHAAAT